MLWIPLTIAAAFAQNLRSLLQKRLTGRLSVNGAAYVRFCFALPLAWVYLLVLSPYELPATTPPFWAYCIVGAVSQIAATACLLATFAWRSFAVGTALSKTEAVQTAVVGLVVLGDRLAPLAWAGIGVSLIGVLLLSSSASVKDVLKSGRGLTLGLLAGGCFALASVAYRGAALALPAGNAAVRAGVTLAVALTLQTAVMGAWLRFREPGEITRVAAAWRWGVWVGICGAVASVGWFTAMTLQASALVRALGQVELLFAVVTSGWIFRERLRPRELVGVATLVIGIYLLL